MRDSTFLTVTVPRALSTYAVATFVILWIGFAIALMVDRAWLDLLWRWAQTLPTAARIGVWVVFLPIPVGLWIWESSWAVLVRLLAMGGMVIWTTLAVSSFIRAWR